MKLISSLVVSTALLLVSAPTDSSKCEVQGLALSRKAFAELIFGRRDARIIERLNMELRHGEYVYENRRHGASEPLLLNHENCTLEPLSQEEKHAVVNDYDTYNANMRRVLYFLTNKGIQTKYGTTGTRLLKLELRGPGVKQDPAFVLRGNGTFDNSIKLKHVLNDGSGVRTRDLGKQYEAIEIITLGRYGRYFAFGTKNINYSEELNYSKLLFGIQDIVSIFNNAGSAEEFRFIVETLNNDTKAKREQHGQNMH